MAASFFPLAELYTPLSYIYFILRAGGTHYFFPSSSVHYYMLCAYRLPYPRSAPITTEYYLLSRPFTFTHWLLTACFFLLIHLYTIPFLMIWTDVDVHY